MKPGDGPDHLQIQMLIQSMLASRGEVGRRSSPRWEDSMSEPATHLQSMSYSPYCGTTSQAPLSLLTFGLLCSALKSRCMRLISTLARRKLAIVTRYSAHSQHQRGILRRKGMLPIKTMQPPFLGTGEHAAARMVPLSANLGFPLWIDR